MRRRISTALFATAAAGAAITTLGFAAAASADAATTGPATGASQHSFAPSGGPPIYTPACTSASGFAGIAPNVFLPLHSGGCAGYAASGRDFRFARAVIRIPAHPLIQHLAQDFLPAEYVGLSSNDSAALAGVMTCEVYHNIFYPRYPDHLRNCSHLGDTWWAVGLVARQHGLSLVDHAVALPNAHSGEGIKFSVYAEPTGNAIHMTVDASGAGGPVQAFYFNAHGAVFTHALALVDFSASDHGVTPPSAPLSDVRATQFLQGAFTTASGQRGTFVGPWTTQPVSITFPGGHAPPYNTVTFEPSFLWNDGMGEGAGDAFGVWWRH
jgi:hypothetical protein